MSSKFSVIVPTRNRRKDLLRCLEALKPSSPTNTEIDYEVIVADDGDDALACFLSNNLPWVRYCVGPQRGPAANRNAGASQAQGEWLVFLDDDCIRNQVG